MNQIKQLLFITLIMSSFFSYAQDNHTVLHDKLTQTQIPEKNRPLRRRHPAKLISFYFDNEDLIDIINFLASQKEVNVVLPLGANAINAKITLHLDEKITVEQAWDILYTLLDIAGYSMIAKENTYNIVKTSKDVYREPLPLYIVKPDEIPDIDKRIRYLYYFNNIKITGMPNADEVEGILRDILPAEGQNQGTIMPTAAFKLDPQTNSVLISDKANNIKAAMKIISALDHVEEQEKPEILQLHHVSADTVANLFNDQLLKTAADANQLRLGIRQPNNSSYFKKVRIIPDTRLNRLIIIGRPQAVERVKQTIQKYIDVELESGKSILHVYQLQYLDAPKFAPILDSIVKAERVGGTEQSKGAAVQGGTERFFSEVIIKADQPETISKELPSSASQGSNSLIIAARNEDYERIKKLIEQLDIPQPQVIIEVLIADLTIQDIVSLGANVRNPLGTGLPSNVNFQSAQTSDILTNSVANPATIQSDLLRRAFNQNGAIVQSCDDPTTSAEACFSAAKFFSQGTALFSFNDAATGQTWGIAQVRKFLDSSKILHHPHLIATNNKEAEIKLDEQRLAIDQGSGSTGGTTTQTRKWVSAALSVKIVPRISSTDAVNLAVVINIEQFETPPTDFTNTGANAPNTANKVSRNVTTNANVRNGHILALGGLTRVDTTVEQLETPLLGKIPIIGWLFKDRTNTTNKNNLTVFISPTIIMPRIRGGVGTYTKNHVQLAKSYSREGMLFDNLRDPITRWFFKTQKDDAEIDLDDFIAQDEFIAPTIFDVRKESHSITQEQKTVKPEAQTVAKAQPNATPAEKDSSKTVLAKAEKTEQESVKATSDLRTMLAQTENPFATPKAKA